MQHSTTDGKYASALPGGIMPRLAAFPVYIWLAGLATGILAVAATGCPVAWWVWALAAVAGGWAWTFTLKRHKTAFLVAAELLTFILLGAMLASVAASRTAALPASLPVSGDGSIGGQVTMQGTLIRWVRLVPGSTSFDFAVDSVATTGSEPQPWQGMVRVRMYGPRRLPRDTGPGTPLSIRAFLGEAQRRDNPGGWDYPAYLQRRGISGIATVRQADLAPTRLKHRPGMYSEALINRLRDIIAKRFALVVPQPWLGLVQALTIGERASLYDPVQQNFREAGTSHLLAISGLHLGIVALWAFVFFRTLMMLLPRKKRPADPARSAAVPAMIFVWLFALLTGAKLPALRAAVMATFFLGSLLLRRRTNPFVTLAWAALVLLLLWPLSLFDVGFQLTFTAVAGILLAAPAARCAWLRRKRFSAAGWMPVAGWGLAQRMWDVIWVSVAAFVVTGPIILVNFKYLTLAGLFTNIVAVPLVTLLAVPLGMIATAWALTGLPGLATVTAPMVGSLHVLVRMQEYAAAAVGGIASPMAATVTAACLFGLGAGLLVLHYFKRRLPAGAAALILAGGLFTAMAPQPAPDHPQLVFFDSGFTPAILLRMPDGASMLIDGSDRGGLGRTIQQALFTYNIEQPGAWLRLSDPPRDDQGPGDIRLPQPVWAPDVPRGETRDLIAGVTIDNMGPLRHGFRLWRLRVGTSDLYLLRPDDNATYGGITRYLPKPGAFAHAVAGIPCNLIKKAGRTAVVSSPQRFGGPMSICAQKDPKTTILHTGTLGAIVCDLAGPEPACRPYAPKQDAVMKASR